MRAFDQLSTCWNFNSIIPHLEIIAYVERKGLEDDLTEALITVIREMDEVYQKWMEQKNKPADGK